MPYLLNAKVCVPLHKCKIMNKLWTIIFWILNLFYFVWLMNLSYFFPDKSLGHSWGVPGLGVGGKDPGAILRVHSRRGSGLGCLGVALPKSRWKTEKSDRKRSRIHEKCRKILTQFMKSNKNFLLLQIWIYLVDANEIKS